MLLSASSFRKSDSLKLMVGALAVGLSLLYAPQKPFAQETIVHRFTGADDGSSPNGLVFDSYGNFFGTTQYGGSGPCDLAGTAGCGTVFEASPVLDSLGVVHWSKKTIYVFQGGTDDGASPAAPVVVDKAGNLYGTTSYGGGTEYGAGCGTVFELSMQGTEWHESILFKFSCGLDGGSPNAITLDKEGNIFGTTYNGGFRKCNGGWPCGVAYELRHTSAGWRESVIHYFRQEDGCTPWSGLVIDESGNLYGTTPSLSGLDNPPPAVVFELERVRYGPSGHPSSYTPWPYKVLYVFADSEGPPFAAELTVGGQSNLYGTTGDGGSLERGNVFELVRPSRLGGSWTYRSLYDFEGGASAWGPNSGLVFDQVGNLYGATGWGGSANNNCSYGCGVVFELIPSNGSWAERVLYSFVGGTDGYQPDTTPVLDPFGNVYGTTPLGGDPNCSYSEYAGCGIVYRISRGLP